MFHNWLSLRTCPLIASSLSSTSVVKPPFFATTLAGGCQEMEPKWPTGEEPHQLTTTNAHAALRHPTPAQARLMGVTAIKTTTRFVRTAVSSKESPSFQWYSWDSETPAKVVRKVSTRLESWSVTAWNWNRNCYEEREKWNMIFQLSYQARTRVDPWWNNREYYFTVA